VYILYCCENSSHCAWWSKWIKVIETVLLQINNLYSIIHACMYYKQTLLFTADLLLTINTQWMPPWLYTPNRKFLLHNSSYKMKKVHNYNFMVNLHILYIMVAWLDTSLPLIANEIYSLKAFCWLLQSMFVIRSHKNSDILRQVVSGMYW